MKVLNVVEVADDEVIDVVTIDDNGAISYLTGAARSLVETRLRLLPERDDAVASLVGWSNGYVTVRAVPNVRS